MTEKLRITNDLKYELAELFNQSGLNKQDFDVKFEFSEFTISFIYDYFSFYIQRTGLDDYYTTIFSVIKKQGESRVFSWIDLKSSFQRWLKEIYFELHGETGWESFTNYNFIFSEHEEINKGFTADEKNKISLAIDEIKNKIKILDIPLENIKVIEAKLDSLNLSKEHLSKFDWKTQFIGLMFSLALTFMVPQEAQGIFWKIVVEAFKFFTQLKQLK